MSETNSSESDLNLLLCNDSSLDAFLKDLHDVLDKHNACVVRPSNNDSNIVLSMVDGLIIREAEFEEEISATDIEFCRYEKQSY